MTPLSQDRERAREWLQKRPDCVSLCKSEPGCGCLDDLATLIAEVREDCAKVAESSRSTSNPIGPLYGAGWNQAVEVIASRIRKGTPSSPIVKE